MSGSSPAPLRVLYACGSRNYALGLPVGYSVHIGKLTEALRDLGCEVETALGGDMAPRTDPGGSPGNSPPTTVAPSARRHPLRALVPPMLWREARAWHVLRQGRAFAAWVEEDFAGFDADVVLERLDTPGGWLEGFARARGVPYVVELHATPEGIAAESPDPIAQRLQRRLERNLRSADAIIGVSGVIEEAMLELGIPEDRVLVVPNGVDLRLFHTGKEPARQSSSGAVVLGFVGGALPWFGLPALLRGLREVRAASTVPVRLTVAGPAGEDPGLRKLVKELALEDAVALVPCVPHDQVPALLRSFDIAVLPRTQEYCSPLKLFEYGALGLPVVAVSTAPIAEVVRHREDGILVPPGDPEALTAALVELVEDPALRTRLGKSLAARVRAHHDWRHSGATVKALLARLALRRDTRTRG